MTLVKLKPTAGERIASVFVLFVVSCFIAAIMFFFMLGAIQMHKEQVKHQWAKQRMAYHGTEMSYEYRGQHYFINKKGQRCRL